MISAAASAPVLHKTSTKASAQYRENVIDIAPFYERVRYCTDQFQVFQSPRNFIMYIRGTIIV